MEEKYFELHRLTSNNEEILRDHKGVCIYCKKEINYKDIIDYIPEVNGLSAVCPFCGIDSVIPIEYNGYRITKEDIDQLNEMYF